MANPLSAGTFTLDSVQYNWEVRHYAGSSSPWQGERGLSLEVRRADCTRKELIVDFPAKDYPAGKPRSPRAFELRIQKCTALALADGWEPESKGKPYRVDAVYLETK